MKYFNFDHLKIVFIAVIVCLIGNIGQAQTLGALYNSSNTSDELRIEKGMALKQALELVGQQFNVVFLYRTDAVQDHKVTNAQTLPNNVEKALDILLEGQDLDYKYLNPKTYGIFYRQNTQPVNSTLRLEQVTGTIFTVQERPFRE